MLDHEYFRELASLALVGDLSPEELAKLTAHLHDCASCQAAYSEFAELTDHYLPLGDRFPSRAKPPATSGVREAVLHEVEKEGLRISPEALRGPVTFRQRWAQYLEELRWAVLPRAAHLGLSAAFLLLVIAAGFAFRYDSAKDREIARLRTDLSRTESGKGELQDQLRQVDDSRSQAATKTEKLEQQLSDAAAHVTRLDEQHQQDLTAIDTLETRISQLDADKNEMAERVSGGEAQLVSLRGELQIARSRAAERETELAASEIQVDQLTNQLKGDQAALGQEQQLLAAGRDVRDLMGARNLHIIDVHDMNAQGEARPFGRIFLTEGKRLIFYAYDLDAAKARNVSFQAWGQEQDGSSTAVNLGILYMDDKAQSRWALKVEDPSLLTAINSVFVTVEPHGGTEKPTGKKLMYAYLRNPINHP